MEAKERQQLNKIAIFVSISCVLQIAESLIPHPIPGLRLGLSNVMTLIALINLGFGYAMEISILRTVLSSFIMGTFMSPTFILSFAGAVISTLMMGLLYWLSSFSKRWRLSIVGISIMGALTHNIVQLGLAYFILIRNKAIFVFFPWLCIGAVIMGWVTGLVAGNVCRSLKDISRKDEDNGLPGARSTIFIRRAESPSGKVPVPVQSLKPAGFYFLASVPPEAKIITVMVLALVIFVFTDLRIYFCLFALLAAVIAVSNVSFVMLCNKTRKYASLILLAFLFPLFLNHGSHVVYSLSIFDITSEGLSAGLLYSLRILFLILANSLLAAATSQQDLTSGLARLISPLKIFGISNKRMAAILSLSLVSIPVYLESAKKIVKDVNFKQVKSLYNLIPLLSNIIIALYTDAEQKSTT